ncbi:MAG: hypothetical protein H6Q10_1431, partial [Acidobacteria bacterium]|nr:hypothetical protein [Acidobacteriota bacterium]
MPAATRPAPTNPEPPPGALVPSSPSSPPSSDVSRLPAADEGAAGQEQQEPAQVEQAVADQMAEKGTAGYLVYFRARPSLAAA